MPQPDESAGRKTLEHVLSEELAHLRRPGELPPRRGDGKDPLAAVYDVIARLPAPLSALCLSGGGIRSATFNLGVLQALARAGLLGSFDYLSTVSGGGYIGSWLQAWMRRERAPKTPDGPPVGSGDAREAVLAELARTAEPDPLRPEPQPIDRLREFSNYLTPRTGLLSADTWTLVAIVLRNLLLNWLVIVPFLAVVVMLPQLGFFVAGAPDLGRPEWARAASWLALLIGLGSSVATHRARARLTPQEPSPDPEERWRQRQALRKAAQAFTVKSTGLLCVAAALLVLSALWAPAPAEVIPGLVAVAPGEVLFVDRFLRALLWTVAVPLAGAALGDPAAREWPPEQKRVVELVAFVVSGLVAALLLAALMGAPWEALLRWPALTVVLGVPTLLTIYALARAVFTAVRSVAGDSGREAPEGAEADQEWWARITARALLAAAVWAGGSALVLAGVWALGHPKLAELGVRHGVAEAVAALGGLSAVAAALLGKGSGTSAGRDGAPAASSRKDLLLQAAAAATIASLVVVLSLGTASLGRWITGDPSFLADGARPLHGRADLLAFVGLGLGLLLLSSVAGRVVDVNRFSLHGMYRNRLVRAYLGASNTRRRPNAFSGFDPSDDALRLSQLRVPDEEQEPVRLFPIVNVTLNVVHGERLAWQQRKAESFSMTPLFCGNFYQGYRDSALYGRRPGGVSLGTAMAVSGAAANPNMGYVSTPALTFLMGLLNARLGVWLPNPGDPGDPVVSQPAPRNAVAHLLRELLGKTDDYSRFVNLSDGGHFDNLGLYEVVLRRCRLVVVSDAGCDPDHGFGDLGNAIRKIRVDFGIPVEFDAEIRIPARGKDGETGPGVLCALGTIRYSAVGDAPDGRLLYLKPTLARRRDSTVPYDVQAYASSSREFPHESTVDQWFSESQFESYRALGDHVVHTLLGDTTVNGWDDLLARVAAHLAAPAATPSGVAGLHAVRWGAGVQFRWWDDHTVRTPPGRPKP